MLVEPDTTVRRSWLSAGAGVYLVVLGVLYLTLVGEIAPEDRWAVAIVATTIFGCGLLLFAGGLVVSPGLRVIFSGAVAGALLVWGALALFSIGALLLVAAVLALFAALAAIEHAGRRGWLLALAAATGGFCGAAASAAAVAL